MAKRKSYSKEFKVDALEKWQSSGQSAAEIEEELGIGSGSLYRWKKDLGAELESTGEPESENAQGQGKKSGNLLGESSMAEELQTDEEMAVPAVGMAESGDDTGSQELEPVYENYGPDSQIEGENLDKTKPSLGKKIAGIVAIFFGALGVVLSIAALIGVWAVNKPITDTSVELLVTVEGALDVVEKNLQRGDQALQTVQDGINAAVNEFVPIDEMSAILDNVNSVVDSAQSTAETAGKVVEAANSVPFLSLGGNQDEEAGQKLDDLAATMDQISSRLDTLNGRVEALAEGGTEGGVLSNINQELDSLQSSLQQAETNVAEAGLVAGELQIKVPKWIDIASIVLSLLILWIGVAQYSLVAHGWGWFKGV